MFGAGRIPGGELTLPSAPLINPKSVGVFPVTKEVLEQVLCELALFWGEKHSSGTSSF